MSLSYPMTQDGAIGKLETFKRRVDGAAEMLANVPTAALELPGIVKTALRYKKVGGLHFAKVGNASVSWSFKKTAKPAKVAAPVALLPSPVSDILADRMARFVK